MNGSSAHDEETWELALDVSVLHHLKTQEDSRLQTGKQDLTRTLKKKGCLSCSVYGILLRKPKLPKTVCNGSFCSRRLQDFLFIFGFQKSENKGSSGCFWFCCGLLIYYFSGFRFSDHFSRRLLSIGEKRLSRVSSPLYSGGRSSHLYLHHR